MLELRLFKAGHWVLLAQIMCLAPTAAAQESMLATYHVHMREVGSDRIEVEARIPIDGDKLVMSDTRSAELPGVGQSGWPALIQGLKVRDENGTDLAFSANRVSGWLLPQRHRGWVNLSYVVDFRAIETANWPSPREAFFRDAEHFSLIGRALFVTTPTVRRSMVQFSLPAGWSPVAPWPKQKGQAGVFQAATQDQLVHNLIVFSKARPDVASESGFNVQIVPMGYWMSVRADLVRVLKGMVAQYVKLVGWKSSDTYTIVLLPVLDDGGESYCNSFAYNGDSTPTAANLVKWAHLIAHEFFHYWNGWRLAGADYPWSQWFQEGFTEYAADRALLRSGAISPADFLDRLGYYVERYKRLETPLSKPGTHKGPPLYSGGALVALCWDAAILEKTQGKRSLDQFWSNLMTLTGGAAKPYDWSTLRSALAETADGDWDDFAKRFIDGTEEAPFRKALAFFGLKVDGKGNVVEDPMATDPEKVRWKRFTAKGVPGTLGVH